MLRTPSIRVRLTWHPGADTVQGWTPDGSRIERAVDEALRLLKEKPVDRRTTEPAPPA